MPFLPLLLALTTLACTRESATPHDPPAPATVAVDTTTHDPPRRIAVTFDDLPLTGPCQADSVLVRTRRLLRHIEAFEVEAAGFVNEGTCAGTDVLEPALRLWAETGHTLGNHTYSHKDLNDFPLGEYIADLERGEPITRRVLAERGDALRYFRHPQLHTGNTEAKRQGLNAYLASNGYIVAPVTIDTQEWVFDAVYRRARVHGDTATMRRVGDAYVPYLESVMEHFEGLSQRVVGYEPPQVLLLHANQINADHFDRVAAMLRDRGYAFVPLDEALADPAYDLEDGYTGPRGLSWLHRWALGKGVETIDEEPREPAWLSEMFRAQ